ncbi:MAG: DNA mismatch repair endonuclease MutL [Dehalococcoidia bacterium]|nr:DNA mismatch repair endonuclease MutL [Dehalococcoidia bacterium]
MSAAASSVPRNAIHVLPPEVAARIAAGEVIERPVSVVRELLDNAIDAGATRIAVEVEDGGLKLIRITDDGRGIPPEEVELAFERHATSKIAGIEELTAVRTLGFRGEALPSIAAAADVEVTTRCAAEPVGVHAVLVDARVVRRTAKPAPPGTAFAVRELFARLPARRKFLSTPVGEARQITVLLSHYALAYPGIAFQLTSNGRRMLVTSGDGDLRHAFAAVYGAEAGGQMLEVAYEEEGVAVSGLAGPPGLHRGNRSAVSVFINGRWVQSRSLVFAIVDAYQSQLPVGRHPVAALAIALPAEDVDINVHPTKAEVRLRDERGVARTVRHAVTAALEGAGPVGWHVFAPLPGDGEADAEGVAAAVAPRAWAPSDAPAPVPLSSRMAPPPVALRPPQPTQTRMDLAATAGGPGRPSTHREVLPLLRVVGQMGSTYVVCEGPDGMYLLDQHAAHERVMYDRLLARPRQDPARQPLLEPLLAELDVALAAVLAEHADHLAALGLELEPFGETSYLVRAVPAGLGGTDIVGALRALLEQLGSDRRVADPFGRAAATVACHSSVRAGMALSLEEMRQLVADLEATASPRTCPHGRPTLVHLSTELLERQFGRR